MLFSSSWGIGSKYLTFQPLNQVWPCGSTPSKEKWAVSPGKGINLWNKRHIVTMGRSLAPSLFSYFPAWDVVVRPIDAAALLWPWIQQAWEWKPHTELGRAGGQKESGLSWHCWVPSQSQTDHLQIVFFKLERPLIVWAAVGQGICYLQSKRFLQYTLHYGSIHFLPTQIPWIYIYNGQNRYYLLSTYYTPRMVVGFIHYFTFILS